MNKLCTMLLGFSLVVAGSAMAAAQQEMPRHEILQITREFTKPYKGGMAHDKTESAFIAAETRAKFPAHYVALNSLSGKSRALFLTPYSSFEEWGKDNYIVAKDKVLAEAFERAGLADGELLDSVDSAVFNYSDELSFHPRGTLSQAHYVEITVFKVRLGHDADWHKLSKMYRDALDAAGSSAHWAMFELMYGGDDGTYIAITGDKSMADIDSAMIEGKKIVDTMGKEKWADLDKLYGETVESAHSELFAVNPKQSYVPEEYIKADPEFWKPWHATPAAKPTAEEKKSKP